MLPESPPLACWDAMHRSARKIGIISRLRKKPQRGRQAVQRKSACQRGYNRSMSRKKSRESNEAGDFVRQQEEDRELLRSFKKMTEEFPSLVAKLEQAIETLQKMSPEEQEAAGERLDKFEKMSKKEQRAFMAKIEKLENEMDSLDERKPS